MNQTQTLALQYADALVAYYRAQYSDNQQEIDARYNALCAAQNALAYAAEQQALNEA